MDWEAFLWVWKCAAGFVLACVVLVAAYWGGNLAADWLARRFGAGVAFIAGVLSAVTLVSLVVGLLA